MNIIQLPKQKPRDQLVPLRAELARQAHELTTSLLESTSAIMAAETAEDLAVAIAELHERVSKAQVNWVPLVDATRRWRLIEEGERIVDDIDGDRL